MKLSEDWLREWVDPPVNTAELADQLTRAGLEVESVEPAAASGGFSGWWWRTWWTAAPIRTRID